LQALLKKFTTLCKPPSAARASCTRMSLWLPSFPKSLCCKTTYPREYTRRIRRSKSLVLGRRGCMPRGEAGNNNIAHAILCMQTDYRRTRLLEVPMEMSAAILCQTALLRAGQKARMAQIYTRQMMKLFAYVLPEPAQCFARATNW
jgi:hypothetical protein